MADILDQFLEVADRCLEARRRRPHSVVGLPPLIAEHIAKSPRQDGAVVPLTLPPEGAEHIHALPADRLDDLVSRIRGTGFPDAGFELGAGKKPAATLFFEARQPLFH
jgi:hypothetical protein